MKQVYRIRQIPFGRDFIAINLFGIVFAVRELSARELNHERIHSAQQRELLYLPFFIWYALEWLILFAKYHDRMKAYRHIRFEEEACGHEHEPNYLKTRKPYRYKG